MNTSKTDELATRLLELLQINSFRAAALPEANFWSIIHYGESSYENRYNRVFRWLLDPTGNHGLGAGVVNGLLSLINATHLDVGTSRVQTAVETFVPQPEENSKEDARQGRIDITLNDVEAKLYLAVECKMSSSQHSEQLSRYRTWVQQTYSDYAERYFIFLTEQAEDPDDTPDEALPHEQWVNITFDTFASITTQVLDEAGDACGSDARSIIKQFLADQRRRSASGLDNLIHPLFSNEPKGLNFGGLLIAAIQQTAPEDAGFSQYALAKKIELLPSENETLARVRAGLVQDFEQAGFSSSDLEGVLQLCWDHRPPTHDHSKNPESARIIRQFAETISGSPLEAGVDTESTAFPDLFRSVKLSKAGQSVNLTMNSGDVIYFAGNNREVVPAVAHHHRRSDQPDIGGNRCSLNTTATKQFLAQNHGGSGEDLAMAFVELLRSQSGDCGCGIPFANNNALEVDLAQN